MLEICRDECLFEVNTACLVQLARAEGGERWELKADPRHMEILVSQKGLSNESKAVSTPVVRTTDEEDGKELDAEGRACYRSWTMRASYPSQDRCELQFAVKELARRMQQPNTKNMLALKRLVRFLKGSPRCLVVYNRQAEQPIVDVFSESDWAGCAKTQWSTSSSYVMLGGHLIASSATSQDVVSDKLRRSGVLRVDQECFESSWRSGPGC